MAHDLLFGKTTRDWSMGAQGDPLIWTPSAIKSEMMRILGIVDAMNQDASRAVKEGRLTPTEWQQWRHTYLASHAYLNTASNLWGSNIAVARGHEREANKWRELIASRGGSLQGPRNLGPQGDPVITPTNVALAIGGVAALSLLITAVKR